MKRKWIAVIIVSICVIAAVCAVLNDSTGYYLSPQLQIIPEPKILPNEWQEYMKVPLEDTTHLVKVQWSTDSSSENTVYCRAVFDNIKDYRYKLVAPWLNEVYVNKRSLVSVSFNIVDRATIPKDSSEWLSP